MPKSTTVGRTNSFDASKAAPVKRRRSNSQKGFEGERKSARQESILKKIDEEERKKQAEEAAKTPKPKTKMTKEDLIRGTQEYLKQQKVFDRINFVEPLEAARREMEEALGYSMY